MWYKMYLVRIDVTRLQEIVNLRAEFTGVILPNGTVFITEPVLLLREPVRLVRPGLRHEIDVEARFLENKERVQSLSDEQAYPRIALAQYPRQTAGLDTHQSPCLQDTAERERR